MIYFIFVEWAYGDEYALSSQSETLHKFLISFFILTIIEKSCSSDNDTEQYYQIASILIKASESTCFSLSEFKLKHRNDPSV